MCVVNVMSVLSAYMSSYYMCTQCRRKGKKVRIRFPRTGVTGVISYHVGAGNKTQNFWQNKSAHNC